MENQKIAQRTAVFSLFSNVVIAILKGIVGLVGHSYALIADAIESIADVASSFLVVLGFRYANRPPDENHPYGHGKVEPLVTFVVVAFLCTAATVIIYESIQHILTPHPVPAPFTLWVLLGIVGTKELLFRRIDAIGKKIGSTSLRADAQHHRSDALSSVFALIGISIGLIGGEKYAAADDWAALVASLFIFYNAYHIFRPALSEVMDENIHQDIIVAIHKIVPLVEEIKELEQCHVRKSGMRYWVDVHIHVDGQLTVDEGHRIAHVFKAKVMKYHPEIEDVLVHVEPV